MKNRLKKIGVVILKGLFIAFITLCLLEVVYRYQWVDFYSGEWKYHKEHLKKEGSNKKLLVFGDSFSADPTGWVYQFSDSLRNLEVFNASLPGVGPETFRLLYKGRMNEVSPNIVVVQLYVGNDLYDIHKPINWSKFSLSRNLFWSFSNRFRFLNFLNYRLGQAKSDVTTVVDSKLKDSFSVEKYSSRTKMLIQGNAAYPENMISLSKPMESSFDKLVVFLKEMKEATPEDCEFKVLVIPHCTEVNQTYIDNYKALGANFSGKQFYNSWTSRLSSEGFNVVDPLPLLLEEESKGNKVYYDNDPHLNKFGQFVVSQYVISELNQ